MLHLWKSIYPCSSNSKTKAFQAFRNAETEKLPCEIILAHYLMARTAKRFRIKEIGSLWDYFQSVFLESITEEDRERSRSLGELFYQEKQNFEQIIEEWRGISPKDFLRTFYYLGQRNASRIIEWENCVAYTKLHQMMITSSNAIIVDPNPDFVFRCMEDKSFMEKDMLFVFPTEALAEIFEMEFSGRAQFAYAPIEKKQRKKPGRKRKDELKNQTDINKPKEIKTQHFIQIFRDPAHKGREPVFQKEKVETRYDIGIIFSHQKAMRELSEFLKMVPKVLETNGTILLHVPQSQIKEVRYGILNHLPQNACNEILLLPNNQESEWLKKQLLMIFSFDKHSHETTTVGKSFNIQFIEGQGGKDSSVKEFICQEPWQLEIPKEKLFSGEKTINHLFELYRPRPKKGNPRKPKSFHFSKEITIWYSLSNGRGEFAFYDIPSSKQIQKNPLPRGKRKTNFVPFRAKNTFEAEQKIQRNILEEPIRSVIQKTIQKAYQNKPLTLKSFWFCQLDKLREKRDFREDIMTELIFSSSFSDILLDNMISLEEYQERMEKDFGDKNKKENLLWQQLNLLLNQGEKIYSQRVFQNPVSNYVNSLIERDWNLERMRKSLVKRSYTLEEEIIITSEIERRLPKSGVHLGAAISFYTGMSNNEICALNWGDYQSISRKVGKQFLVYKQIESDGNIKKFSVNQKNAYRRIPIVEELKNLLEKRLSYLLKSIGKSSSTIISEKDIRDLPIVTNDETAFEMRCMPAQLKRIKDDLEKFAGILPMEGSVTGNGQEGKTTDFNRYQGDRFRENFRYRTTETCLLTVAERNYLLGISLPDTFSKHYCDFINDISQLTMAQKLKRWSSLHHQNDAKDASEIAFTEGNPEIRLSRKKCNYRVCVDLDMILRPLEDKEAQFVLKVEDNCGVDIDFYTIAIGGNKNESAG